MNDQELNNFLASLREDQPDQLTMARWKSAVGTELSQGEKPKRSKSTRWLELTAAVLVGVAVGAAAFGHRSETTHEENSADSATIEFVVTKRN